MDNHKQGLSSHLTQVLYFQPSTGALLAVMDGESITAMRTAAASVVATKYLAKEDSKVLSILGAGVQAYSHAKALTSSFKFDKIFIWNRTQSTGEKFCEEIKHLAKVVKFCPSTKEAVCDADVIVTATFSSTPILHGQDLKESVHINSVGACTPHLRELDDRCMELCAVIADSRVSALAESGDIISAKKEVLCEVGNIINGEVEVNRTRRTLFKSLGIAVEDVTAANLVWEKVGKQQPVGF
ncbi:unnamed protein product [Clavelina lepadiformis]|uniref:Thiomorpholine-carboxylate dehydrogenase n=1 Tax=Clavelina lepadiformis TaxID=159417 RepID=A0ABP0FE70_CLALP